MKVKDIKEWNKILAKIKKESECEYWIDRRFFEKDIVFARTTGETDEWYDNKKREFHNSVFKGVSIKFYRHISKYDKTHLTIPEMSNEINNIIDSLNKHIKNLRNVQEFILSKEEEVQEFNVIDNI